MPGWESAGPDSGHLQRSLKSDQIAARQSLKATTWNRLWPAAGSPQQRWHRLPFHTARGGQLQSFYQGIRGVDCDLASLDHGYLANVLRKPQSCACAVEARQRVVGGDAEARILFKI